MTGMLLFAGALLAQSAAVLQPQAGRDAVSDDQAIIATAPTHRSSGWLTTSGPDEQGRYTARIEIADLDPATEAGSAAMASRVARAKAVLCEISAEQPQIRGFYNGGERDCWRNTQDQAFAQMGRIRQRAQ